MIGRREFITALGGLAVGNVRSICAKCSRSAPALDTNGILPQN
jgi:hypothetical protein